MFLKWFPWKFMIKRAARARGFVDPILLLSTFNRFSQPSEVWAPVELMRAGAVLHARGLINSQVIQHNLDWVWPYWVERQFEPLDISFIPRAFSMTHINLTHRNWTATGIPGFDELSLVDPRGLVTPLFDSWSIDGWVTGKDGRRLVPSREKSSEQRIVCDGSAVVITRFINEGLFLETRVESVLSNGVPVCRIDFSAESPPGGLLVVSLRPYNPEGVSFIHDISLFHAGDGWRVNKKWGVVFNCKPDHHRFSEYKHGDVYHWIDSKTPDLRRSVHCEVGMATAMAAYNISPGQKKQVMIQIPLEKGKTFDKKVFPVSADIKGIWKQSIKGICEAEIPWGRFEELYRTAIHTLVLHSPDECYAGPYTYKRFWFRDAAFIVNALLLAGLQSRAERIISNFFSRQNLAGYFHSQEGEWDSNGEALWAMWRYCLVSGVKPPVAWLESIEKAAEWIVKKRIAHEGGALYSGLFPAGFSAEHLGPNDYYYWDDFWGVAGLKAASWLLTRAGDSRKGAHYYNEALSFMRSIEESLMRVAGPNRRPIIPASPFRRPDSGAVGSLSAGYPLKLFDVKDERLLLTAGYLVENCLVNDAFYHDISHSGINPYLTLHIAQVLMRGGDRRFFRLMNGVAALASPTGQWPEAIHPRIGTGCMGDGQHVWAAAEWTLAVRNCFLREEEESGKLVLCSGITKEMLESGARLRFGPAPSSFGPVTVTIEKGRLSWEGQWHGGEEPSIEVSFPFREPEVVGKGVSAFDI
jgi:hypothetical protein